MRTKTPPTLKWLLSERAAIAGELKVLQKRISQQRACVRRHQRQLATAELRLASLLKLTDGPYSRRAALDATIALINRDVEPSAGGVVHAWARKYGKRGDLKAFLRESVRAASPASLTTDQLLDAVIERFNLELPEKGSRRAISKNVRSYLGRLVQEGDVQRLHLGTRQDRLGSWRWAESAPSLEQLRALAGFVGALNDERTPYQDGPRGQVGGE